MVAGALLVAPFGIADAGGELLEPELLGVLLAVALASSVLPYSLELEALRRLPERVFGVLMSLEPAVAALAGFVVLGQDLARARLGRDRARRGRQRRGFYARGVNHRGLIALSGREVNRVLKLWTQTVLAPILSSSLFILVFGLSLGSRIKDIDGASYDVYIVPGLIAMTMAQAAYANNSATVFQARFDRYLNDVLAAPMRAWQVNLALNVGGAVRALLIGLGLLAVALPITGVPIHAPLALAAAIVLLLVLFCSFGIVVGIYAESWDHTAFVTNLVILPLSFLGGVFYSVARLPSPWEEISRLNPVHYLIDAVRYGFLGRSDTSIWLCARPRSRLGRWLRWRPPPAGAADAPATHAPSTVGGRRRADRGDPGSTTAVPRHVPRADPRRRRRLLTQHARVLRPPRRA